MSGYVIKPKRELQNAPLILAFFIGCILLAGFLQFIVAAIDVRTQEQLAYTRAYHRGMMAALEQPYVNPMAERLQKKKRGVQ